MKFLQILSIFFIISFLSFLVRAQDNPRFDRDCLSTPDCAQEVFQDIYATLSERDISDGIAKLESGDFEGAIEDFNRAMEAKPMNRARADYAALSERDINDGIAKLESGDFEGAIEDFNRAMEANPVNRARADYAALSESYLHLGIAKLESGDHRGGQRRF